ncbi:MAG: FliH/SctL family protein [Bryobacteraceae bacterium]
MLSKILRGESGYPVQRLEWPAEGVQRAVSSPDPRRVEVETADDGRRAAARLQELERQCEKRVQDTRQRAFQEGEAAGRSRADAELQPFFEKLARTTEDLAQLKPRLFREAEEDMVQLSLAVARRILHRELSVDPQALHGLVRACLEKVASQEISRIRVHPDLEAGIRQILASAARSNLQTEADPALDRGDIVFETSRGSLDGSIEAQLAEIGRGFADCLPESRR